MINDNVFVPRILLCGDKEEFFTRVGQRPFELIGQVKFFGEAKGEPFNFLREGRFLLNDKFLGYAELPKIIRGGYLNTSFSTTPQS